MKPVSMPDQFPGFQQTIQSTWVAYTDERKFTTN